MVARRAILAGSRTLVLKRTPDTNSTVTSVSFTVTASQDQTIYAIGGAAGTAVTSLVVTDDNPDVAATQTRIRFVNLSPRAGAVDVFVTAPNTELAAATPAFSNVAYRAASTYSAVTAGTFQVRVVRRGQPRRGAQRRCRSTSRVSRWVVEPRARSPRRIETLAARRSRHSC